MFLLYFNVVTDLLIALALMWIMRQSLYAKTRSALGLRIILAMIALPYLIKVHERVCYLDYPTVVDAVRDLGVLLLLVLAIWNYADRFDHL